MNIPDQLRYTESHEWIALDGDVATIGISDHAQSELGDVVYLDLPEIGRQCSAGDSIAVIESVKAASDIYAPLAGEVVAVNDDAKGDTGVINTDPYGKGWLFKLKLANPADVTTLLDAAGYQARL